ncbi:MULTISPECIES: hypothetical protein [unclassified Endozoicomonas]|uniref:hypothetical protein n=1 Tax=unclassified Endozoicomonas TaxID=2644528 RepID=UPI003BB788CB
MADLSGPQGSDGPLYSSSPVKNNWKTTVKALLGGILRKIRKAGPHGLPSLKTEQAKSKQPDPKPPTDLKSRVAAKAESKIFIQVLPLQGQSISAPIPTPGSPESPSSVNGQQERSGNEVESNRRSNKKAPPVAPRRSKSLPRQPPQVKEPTDELVQSKQQEQPDVKERPVPTPRTRRKNSGDLSGSLSRAPQPKPRNQGKEALAGNEKPGQANIYDVPGRLKKEPEYDVPANRKRSTEYDVPGNLKTKQEYNVPANRKRSPEYDVPANLKAKPEYDVPVNRMKSTDYDIPRDLKVSSDYDVPKSLNFKSSPQHASDPERVRSDSIDPSTGENIYQSINDEEFELEMLELELELEDVSQNLGDAYDFQPLFNDSVWLDEQMFSLIKTFKSQRPPKSNLLKWAAHMKQERSLMQLYSNGFDKFRKSIRSLMSKGLTSIQDRDKLRSSVDKINKILTPALIAEYGAEEARKRLLKAPEG